MKITFDWLKDHLHTNLKEEKLLDQLTNIGLEVESLQNLLFYITVSRWGWDWVCGLTQWQYRCYPVGMLERWEHGVVSSACVCVATDAVWENWWWCVYRLNGVHCVIPVIRSEFDSRNQVRSHCSFGVDVWSIHALSHPEAVCAHNG